MKNWWSHVIANRYFMLYICIKEKHKLYMSIICALLLGNHCCQECKEGGGYELRCARQ